MTITGRLVISETIAVSMLVSARIPEAIDVTILGMVSVTVSGIVMNSLMLTEMIAEIDSVKSCREVIVVGMETNRVDVGRIVVVRIVVSSLIISGSTITLTVRMGEATVVCVEA